MSPSDDYDVAVVGLGPVGGILANLVGLEGLSVVAIDREKEAPQLPRGVGIDAEMMRVAQAIGLAERLEPYLKVFRGTQYLDVDGNVVSTRPSVEGRLSPQGWPARYNVHQPDFENVMRAGLDRYPNVVQKLGYDVTAVREDGGRGVVVAVPVDGGSAETLRARYVVGCDGARSVVRKAAGVRLDDFGLNQPWIVADFEINEKAELPAINTHYADPETPAIYIHVVRNLRRFEFRAREGEDLVAAVEPENLWKRMSRWLTPDQAELLRVAVYTHRSLVAENWRKGPLVVAGDAAHQTPPFLGQGLCAGVRDAASIAWRLGAIVKRGAPDALVDSYQTERSEHARFIIQTATQLGTVLTSPDKSTLDALNKRIGREGSGRTPRLGAGVWVSGGPADAGGTLAPQPTLADGRLIDDAIGYRFGVVLTSALAEALDDSDRTRAEERGIVFVTASGATAAWLGELESQAVILRPDRYYYGTFATATELASALASIGGLIAPSRAA